jgi:peptide deformylase
MHQAPGVGLAAPQVGLAWRLFVCNPSGEVDDDHVMVNPVLVDPSRQSTEAEEGCLSLPEVRAPIRRPQAITIEATDLDGNPIKATSDDLEARVWQHEYDHLEAVLIIDRMAPIDRMVHRQILREMENDFEA